MGKPLYIKCYDISFNNRTGEYIVDNTLTADKVIVIDVRGTIDTNGHNVIPFFYHSAQVVNVSQLVTNGLVVSSGYTYNRIMCKVYYIKREY